MAKIYGNLIYLPMHGTLKEWEEANTVLLEGQEGIATDGGPIYYKKIGDGVTCWNDLEWKTGPQGEQGEKGDKGEKGDIGPDGMNVLTFDTEDHFIKWSGKNSKNLVPLSVFGSDINSDGTFNITYVGTQMNFVFPLPAGTYTLSLGTGGNCEFFPLFETSNGYVTTEGTFSSDTDIEVILILASDEPINAENVWVQIEKGETATEYECPMQYFRSDGITPTEVEKGQLFLIEEEKAPAFWWNGKEALEILGQKGETGKDGEILNGNSSGENIVVLDDISAVNNELNVKLTGDDIADFSDVSVSAYGKNIYNLAPEITTDTFVSAKNVFLPENGKITKPITISATAENLELLNTIWRVHVIYEDGSSAYINDKGDKAPYNGFPETFNASEENPIVKIEFRSTYITGGKYKNIQIEYGTSATDYVEYEEPVIYAASSEGVVEGIKAKSANLELISNKEGINIECKYNKSLDIVTDKLTQAIIALGGTV